MRLTLGCVLGDSLAVTCMIIFALSLIPETSGASYPLQRKGLLPTGKKVGESLNRPSIKTKSKKKKSSSKNTDSKGPHKKPLDSSNPKFIKQSGKLEIESEYPTYKAGLYNKSANSFPRSSLDLDTEKREPSYDCPLFFNGKDAAGQAIIKPDPFDCSCCYYCNWGIHYVQCCSWPLLWNDGIKSCDWYWRVKCLTFDGWED